MTTNNISGQFVVDKKDELDDEESDEESKSIEDSEEDYRVDENKINFNKVNNYKLIRDKLDLDKLNDLDKANDRTVEEKKARESELDNERNQLNANRNEPLKRTNLNEMIDENDNSSISHSNYNRSIDRSNQIYNQLNENKANSQSNATASTLKASQTIYSTSIQTNNQIDYQINNRTDNQPNKGQTTKEDNKIKNLFARTLSSYYNNRLKARHVASGDQLRILRREGQPLRLSCLPAFHAPTRSTVHWFKNGDLIKVIIFLYFRSQIKLLANYMVQP